MRCRRRAGLVSFLWAPPSELTYPVSGQRQRAWAACVPPEAVSTLSVGFPRSYTSVLHLTAIVHLFCDANLTNSINTRGSLSNQSSTCLSFVTITSGLCRLLPIFDHPIPDYSGGPIQRWRTRLFVLSNEIAFLQGLILFKDAFYKINQCDCWLNPNNEYYLICGGGSYGFCYFFIPEGRKMTTLDGIIFAIFWTIYEISSINELQT